MHGQSGRQETLARYRAFFLVLGMSSASGDYDGHSEEVSRWAARLPARLGDSFRFLRLRNRHSPPSRRQASAETARPGEREEADQWLYGTVKEVVAERFVREWPHLKALPAMRFDTSYRERRVVAWDGYI
jgi:hypothetical protein